MYSVKNTKVYNWPPAALPCQKASKNKGGSCGCGPQYPNNRSLCPFKGPNCACGKNCSEGTGSCPCRQLYDDSMKTGPLCSIPNGCVYQGPTLQGTPTFGYKKPIPMPYVNYNKEDIQRSPYDNSPGCLSFVNRGPF